MKLLGILLALLGGGLKLIDPYHLNLVGDGSTPLSAAGGAHVGIVPLAILAASAYGFFSDGRMTGIALMFISFFGLFFDGGLLIALPFVGSMMILWAANMRTSTPNS